MIAMRKFLLFLGGEKYPHRPDLRMTSFRPSYEAVRAYMLDGQKPIIAKDDCLDLFDTDNFWPQQQQIVDEWLTTKLSLLNETEEPKALLIYYVGHGSVLGGDQVSLTINSTTDIDPYFSSIPRASLAKLLQRRSANAFRKFLIIDCCFAAKVVNTLLSPLQDMLTIELEEVGKEVNKADGGGLAALCASSSVASAKGNGRNGLTQFTDGLLEALRVGDPGTAPKNLSFDVVRRIIGLQLYERYGADAVAPSSYFPDDVFEPIHTLPLLPNLAHPRAKSLPAQTGPTKRDLDLFKNIRAEAEKISAIFRKSDFVPPRILQGLARPIEFPAVKLSDLGIIDELLDKNGESWEKDAAIFTAAVIIYKKQEEQYFDRLVEIASDGRTVRGATMWRVLRAVKKLSARVDVTESRRSAIVRALISCACHYDSPAGQRFDTRTVILMVAQTAILRRLKIDLRSDRVFSDEQAKEWERFEAERRHRPSPK